MTVGVVAILAILAIWVFGIWIGHQEKIRHQPRHQGRYRSPCLDVTYRGHGEHGNGMARTGNPNQYFC